MNHGKTSSGTLIFQKGRSTISSPFLRVYNNFRNDLKIVERINKRLPTAIKNMSRKDSLSLREKIRNFRRNDATAFSNFQKALGEETNRTSYRVKIPFSKKASKVIDELIFWFIFETRSVMFIRDMSLVYLVAEYESFLQHTLCVLFELRPEAMISTHRSFTVEELIKCNDVQEVRETIYRREAESVIREDIEEVRKHFKDRLSVDLAGFTNWKQFSERFYRRNILVHNSGVVNEIYRKKTGFRRKTSRMTVSQTYLTESIRLFDESARKTAEHFQARFKRVNAVKSS